MDVRPARVASVSPAPPRAPAETASSVRAAFVAHLVSLVLGALVITAVDRRQWFFADDFGFLVTQRRLLQDGHVVEWLLRGQNQHPAPLPLLLYEGLYRLVGLHHYWPYLVPLLFTHLLVVALVRTVCRRAGVRAWTATALAAVVVVLGAGAENLTFAVQITYLGSIAAGLGLLLATDHDGPLDRRDALGVVLGVVALACSTVAVVMILAAALNLALRRRRRAALVAAGPALGLFALWYLAYGGGGTGDGAPSLTSLPAYTARGVVATFEGLSGIPRVGALLAIGVLALAVVTFPRQRAAGRVAPWALAAAVPLTFALIGLDRAGFGVDQAASSRYVYIGVVLVVPLVGVLVDRLPHGIVATAAVAALVAVALVVNVGRLVDQAHRSAQRALYVRDAVVGAASLDGLDAADPMARPEPRFSPDLTLAALAAMVDEGRIPRQRDLDPARRAGLAADYLVWLARPGDQAPMAGAVLAAATRGRLGPHRQGCQLATPSGGGAAWTLHIERPVRLRLAGLKAGTAVTVTVRDPASGVAAPPRALVVPWAAPADLTLAAVGLDVDVSVPADADFTVCAYEPGRPDGGGARATALTAN